MEQLSRRSFIGRSGAFVAAFGMAGLVPIEAALAGQAGTLAPERRERFKALVEALAESPTIGVVDGSRADELADDLARDYADGDEGVRLAIDVLLDSLDYDGGTHRKGSFKARSKQGRLEHLRERANDTRPLDSERRMPRLMYARYAAGLAVAPFKPDIERYGPWSLAI